MLIKLNGVSVDITKELQDTLLENQPQLSERPVAQRKADDLAGLIPKKDDAGNIIMRKTEKITHPFVFFDVIGRHYFNVFKLGLDSDEKNALQPLKPEDLQKLSDNLKAIKEDPKTPLLPMFGRGEYSHSTEISGSELWDNGKNSDYKVKTSQAKGISNSRIVAVLTSSEVLDINIKPQDKSVMSKILNMDEIDRNATMKSLAGDRMWQMMQDIANGKLVVSDAATAQPTKTK